MTARTAYSEGDAKSQLEDIREKSPTPPMPQDNISQDWQKYVTHLEVNWIFSLFLFYEVYVY